MTLADLTAAWEALRANALGRGLAAPRVSVRVARAVEDESAAWRAAAQSAAAAVAPSSLLNDYVPRYMVVRHFVEAELGVGSAGPALAVPAPLSPLTDAARGAAAAVADAGGRVVLWAAAVAAAAVVAYSAARGWAR